MDHIIHAQMKGETSEENVLYIAENINVAGIETAPWNGPLLNWLIIRPFRRRSEMKSQPS